MKSYLISGLVDEYKIKTNLFGISPNHAIKVFQQKYPKAEDMFDKNHFIFPVKSIDGSRSRFLYKSTLGHTIIKNYKNYKK